jgi:dolichyl-phosphate-mannose--protein O-mannosyl transferase
MTENKSIPVKVSRDVPFISRIRRNHGLEHATLHILSKRYPKQSMAGHSDYGGFWIIGDVSIEDVYESVEEALTRLRDGEKNLAVHRNCGTNFVTSGVLAGLAAGASMLGVGRRTRDKLERLPVAMFVATLDLIFAQPLGFFMQEKVTTSAEPGDLQVIEIVTSRRGGMKAHRITTRN